MFVLLVTVVVTVAASADLDACGDKFLRVGRSARFRRYAAVHPASILIYTPANSTPAGMKEFEAVLKRAGHKPVSVGRGVDISSALDTARFDVVIADYADAATINHHAQATASKPAVLPILYKASKSAQTEAERQYACLIRPEAMTKYDALAEIDRLLQRRASEP